MVHGYISDSLEEILALKAEEAGKVLNTEEKEYVCLQFERNSLLRLFPNSEDRDRGGHYQKAS